MPGQHLVDRAAVAAVRGSVDHVEQLPDRHSGRALGVRALVVARVGDDQPVRRREEGVEEQLAILRARVAIADVRVVEGQIVAVADGLAREDAVVEPEEDDDPMGHRAHRHQRADRHVPGAEVRAGRAALQALGEQRPDLRQGELGRVGGAADRRLADHVVEQALELRPLPRVALARRGQRVGGAGDRGRPRIDRLRRRRRRRPRRGGGR
jgi:hypothetical protein